MTVALVFFGLLVVLTAAAFVFAVWRGCRSWFFTDLGKRDDTNMSIYEAPPYADFHGPEPPE